MLRYLLDTNTVSALMRGEPSVATRVAGTSREDVAISQVTAAEVEFGLRYLPASRRRRALEAQWSAIGGELVRLPWSDEVCRRFGEPKAQLEKAGRRMSDFDLAIAVHALAYGLPWSRAGRGSGAREGFPARPLVRRRSHTRMPWGSACRPAWPRHSEGGLVG